MDEWFEEEPRPVHPEMFPTWPAKSELSKTARKSSPKPPSGGKQYKQMVKFFLISVYLQQSLQLYAFPGRIGQRSFGWFTREASPR